MESIKLNNDNTYKLEVNDNGEYIEFDLTDLELPLKAINCAKNIGKFNDDYMKEISKYAEKDWKDINKIEEITNVELNFCKNARIELDKFLGEGACQKIFGNKNRYGMINELFDLLEPHLKKMHIKIDVVKKNLLDKYSPKDKNVM